MKLNWTIYHGFKAVALTVLIILVLVLIGMYLSRFEMKNSELSLYVEESPSSLDPLTFDLVKHHAIQSLVNIKLFSSYRAAQVVPMLVKSWRSNPSHTKWEFLLRDDVFFTNGDKVDAHIVKKSITRALYLLKKNQSRHEFLRKVIGINRLDSPESEIVGIRASGSSFEIEFSSSTPDVIELLSFGIFGIVHSSSFDSKSGSWETDIKGAITSGPYKIEIVDSEKIILEKRENYPLDLSAKRSFRKLELILDSARKESASMFRGVSGEREYGEDRMFFGSGPSKILYFFVHVWNSSGHPLADIKLRRLVRDLVVKNFQEAYGKSTRSFFPMTIPGIDQIQESSKSKVDLGKSSTSASIRISFVDVRPSRVQLSNFAMDALEKAVSEAGFLPDPKTGFKIEEVIKNKDPNKTTYDVDIGYYTTGLSIANPDADVRLMFSKEGIWLPDSSGEISRLLSENPISLAKVNQKIYDQAIVWPVVHYSMGLWAAKDLDLSDYNTQLPPGELQWIGSK